MYAFPRTEAGLLPWSFAEGLIDQAREYWLASVRPDGRPHVTPLWGVWVDGLLYFDGPPITRWARNIAQQPQVSMHLEHDGAVVILEGRVEDLTLDPDLGGKVVGRWAAKYGRAMPDPVGEGIFRLRPRVVRGWSSDALADGSRWRLSVESNDAR